MIPKRLTTQKSRKGLLISGGEGHYFHTKIYKVLIKFKEEIYPGRPIADIVGYYCGCQCPNKSVALDYAWKWLKQKITPDELETVESVWVEKYNYYLICFFSNNKDAPIVSLAMYAKSIHPVLRWAKRVCEKHPHKKRAFYVKKKNKFTSPYLKAFIKQGTISKCGFCFQTNENRSLIEVFQVERFENSSL